MDTRIRLGVYLIATGLVSFSLFGVSGAGGWALPSFAAWLSVRKRGRIVRFYIWPFAFWLVLILLQLQGAHRPR